MALGNFFKRKKAEKKEEIISKEDKTEKKEVERKKEGEAVIKSEKKVIAGEVYRVLKSPHISEKATNLAQKNQYVFNIWKDANKPEIKKAIEEVYGIDVLSVKIINIPGKKRRLGKISGFKKGYKKAIVRIKEGQKIEVMPQ